MSTPIDSPFRSVARASRLLLVAAATQFVVALPDLAAQAASLEGDSISRPAGVRLTSVQRRQFEEMEVLLRNYTAAEPIAREGIAREYLRSSNPVKELMSGNLAYWRIRARMALVASDARAGREAARELSRPRPADAATQAIVAELHERGWGESTFGAVVDARNLELRSIRLLMVSVKPATFHMGDLRAAPTRTRVTLTQPYWIGATEVTNEQWRRVMGRDAADFAEGLLPKVGVTWEEAMEFCRKLTGFERAAGRLPEGYEFSLPTEAQWELAARAGNLGPDTSDIDASAWHAGNSGGRLRPVGLKTPNAWGIHGMLGNASEWCLDWYADEIPAGDLTDPRGPSTGTHRVARGGNFASPPSVCRPSHRGSANPGGDALLAKVGFRIVLLFVPRDRRYAPLPHPSSRASIPRSRCPRNVAVMGGRSSDFTSRLA